MQIEKGQQMWLCQTFGDVNLYPSKTFGVTGTPWFIWPPGQMMFKMFFYNMPMDTVRSFSHTMLYSREHLETEIQTEQRQNIKSFFWIGQITHGWDSIWIHSERKKHCQTLSNQTRHWDWQRTSWRKSLLKSESDSLDAARFSFSAFFSLWLKFQLIDQTW